LEQRENDKSPEADWPAFAKNLRRLLGHAMRLWRRRGQWSEATHASRRRLEMRLEQRTATPRKDAHAKRLVKRLRRRRSHLFTFLDQQGIPFGNNGAERAIRPAVIIGKNSYDNRSARGADCQAVSMSIFRTLERRGHDPRPSPPSAASDFWFPYHTKQRGHGPIRTAVAALAAYPASGRLPPVPKPKKGFRRLKSYRIGFDIRI